MAINRSFSGINIRKPGIYGPLIKEWHFPQSNEDMYDSKKKAEIHNHVYNLMKILVKAQIADGQVRAPSMWDPTMNNGMGGEVGGQECIMFKTTNSVNINTIQEFIDSMIKRYDGSSS